MVVIRRGAGSFISVQTFKIADAGYGQPKGDLSSTMRGMNFRGSSGGGGGDRRSSFVLLSINFKKLSREKFRRVYAVSRVYCLTSR